jgi:hypothetical protein
VKSGAVIVRRGVKQTTIHFIQAACEQLYVEQHAVLFKTGAKLESD